MSVGSSVPFFVYALVKLVLAYFLCRRIYLSIKARFRGTLSRCIIFLACLTSALNDIRYAAMVVSSRDRVESDAWRDWFVAQTFFHFILIPLFLIHLGVFVSAPTHENPVQINWVCKRPNRKSKIRLSAVDTMNLMSDTARDNHTVQLQMALGSGGGGGGGGSSRSGAGGGGIMGSSEEEIDVEFSYNAMQMQMQMDGDMALSHSKMLNNVNASVTPRMDSVGAESKFELFIVKYSTLFYYATYILSIFLCIAAVFAFNPYLNTQHLRFEKRFGFHQWTLDTHLRLNPMAIIGKHVTVIVASMGLVVGAYVWMRYKYWLFFVLLAVTCIGYELPIAFSGALDFYCVGLFEALFYFTFYQTDSDMFGDLQFLMVAANAPHFLY